MRSVRARDRGVADKRACAHRRTGHGAIRGRHGGLAAIGWSLDARS